LTLATRVRVPHGYTVTKPALLGLVTATLSDTAATPDAGTRPRPVACTWSTCSPPTWRFATERRAWGLSPARVSKTRSGVIGLNMRGTSSAALGADGALDPTAFVATTVNV
jgi:hypothetical protein